MRAHQLGFQLYTLLRSRTNPNACTVHESCRDLSAMGAHEASAHEALYFPTIRAILEHNLIESYDALSSG